MVVLAVVPTPFRLGSEVTLFWTSWFRVRGKVGLGVRVRE